MGVLRQMEGGVPAAELCREHRMSSATLYTWRAKCNCMDASFISEMKAMAEENRRLKRMEADVSMQNDLLKKELGKKTIRPAQLDGQTLIMLDCYCCFNVSTIKLRPQRKRC